MLRLVMLLPIASAFLAPAQLSPPRACLERPRAQPAEDAESATPPPRKKSIWARELSPARAAMNSKKKPGGFRRGGGGVGKARKFFRERRATGMPFAFGGNERGGAKPAAAPGSESEAPERP